MGASVAAAAVVVAKERQLVDQFRQASATSPVRAQAAHDLGIRESIAFRRLRRHEVIREASPGFFYLDEPIWIAVRRTRRRLAVVLVMIVLVVAAGTTLGFLSLK